MSIDQGVGKMHRWLKHSAHGLVVAVAVLVVPSALSSLSAAPFAFVLDSYFRLGPPGQVRNDVVRIHCCHSHPYPPYDRYCCHGGRGSYAYPSYARPGRAVARTAVGAAAAYGAYRGVRSATKSAYKRGYNKAKKNYRRRR